VLVGVLDGAHRHGLHAAVLGHHADLDIQHLRRVGVLCNAAPAA
jgi:hypothetical protein